DVADVIERADAVRVNGAVHEAAMGEGGTRSRVAKGVAGAGDSGSDVAPDDLVDSEAAAGIGEPGPGQDDLGIARGGDEGAVGGRGSVEGTGDGGGGGGAAGTGRAHVGGEELTLTAGHARLGARGAGAGTGHAGGGPCADVDGVGAGGDSALVIREGGGEGEGVADEVAGLDTGDRDRTRGRRRRVRRRLPGFGRCRVAEAKR